MIKYIPVTQQKRRENIENTNIQTDTEVPVSPSSKSIVVTLLCLPSLLHPNNSLIHLTYIGLYGTVQLSWFISEILKSNSIYPIIINNTQNRWKGDSVNFLVVFVENDDVIVAVWCVTVRAFRGNGEALCPSRMLPVSPQRAERGASVATWARLELWPEAPAVAAKRSRADPTRELTANSSHSSVSSRLLSCFRF